MNRPAEIKSVRRLIPVGLLLIIVVVSPVLAQNTHDQRGGGSSNCNDCHLLHGADISGPTPLANPAVAAANMCLSCHSAGGPAEAVDPNFVITADHLKPSFGGGIAATCTDCHTPHVGGALTNIRLIRPTITTPNSGDKSVVFTAETLTNSYADADATLDGVCEVCHTLTQDNGSNAIFRNSAYSLTGTTHAGRGGVNCTSCHSHSGGFEPSGCTGCHASATDNSDGPPTRRAVVGEFSLTSHHVAGAVSDQDCEVCHYEAADSAYHQNNQVDLRDPDTGGVITGFTSFTRNRSSDALESWVTNVQNNFCLKCHDGDGAAGAYVAALGFTNPLRPFSSASRDVPNVADSIVLINSNYHPILGPQNNPRLVGVTPTDGFYLMEPPWNQDTTGGPNNDGHDVISCFDCHKANGHGGNYQRMLREDFTGRAAGDGINFDTLVTSGQSNLADMGTPIMNFCTLCHRHDSYHASGVNGDDVDTGLTLHNNHSDRSPNVIGCMGCHAGPWNGSSGVLADNGASPGAIHGNNFYFPSGYGNQYSVGFLMGGFITSQTGTRTSGTCSGDGCKHSPGSAPSYP